MMLMSNRTKYELEAALKEALLKKPYHKITIQDLTDACHISRMSFYYHFQDMQDLIEWACIEDAKKALENKKHANNWQEGLARIFEAVYENKPFIMNVYRAISREQIENYLFSLTRSLIMGVVEEQSKGFSITEEQKTFIADFYKYSFVGIMLDWIKQGMKEDYHEIVHNIIITIHGSIGNSIKNFTNPAL